MTATDAIHGDPSLDYPETVAWLEQMGATVVRTSEVAIPNDPRINYQAGLELNVRVVPLDFELVERYARAMDDGDRFPPAILREDHPGAFDWVPLCGNHRLAAANRTKAELDCIIISCDDRTAFQIAFGDNSRHGMPPTDIERVRMALRLIENYDISRTDACRFTNCSSNRVATYQRAADFRRRAEPLGVQVQKIKGTEAARLAQIPDDHLMAATADIVIDHKPTFDDLSTTITRMNSATNPAGVLTEWEAKLKARNARLSRKAYGRLLDNAMRILDLPTAEEIVRDIPEGHLTGDSRKVWLHTVKRTRDKLNAVMAAMKEE